MCKQTCDLCGTVPDELDSFSFSDRYLCDECANRAIQTLDFIARWWQDGGHSLSPDALLGESDLPIRDMVEQATGIRREDAPPEEQIDAAWDKRAANEI